MLPPWLTALACLLLFSACAPHPYHAIQSSSGTPADAHQDFVYLLETLDDGKIAQWQDSRGSQHGFAVFSTYSVNNQICRDYYHSSNSGAYAGKRMFGTSCRIHNQTWQYIPGSERGAEDHYRRFLQLDEGFKQSPSARKPAAPSSSLRNMPSPRAIAYPSSYTLSPLLSERCAAAEQQYRIPLRSMIDDVSRQQNFHPCFIHSVVYYESGYNPRASSPCCSGLMQLSQAAAKEAGVNNRHDPLQNLQGGARYLHMKLDEPGINGNIGLALASYNCGYGTIKNNNFQIPERCWSNNPQEYVEKILSQFRQCN